MNQRQRQPLALDDENWKRPANSRAWAIGYETSTGFRVRRIIWGRLHARTERRDGEHIRGALVLIADRRD